MLALASLGVGCALETPTQMDEQVGTAKDELFRAWPTWPGGTVRLCWSSSSMNRSDFFERAATIRERANAEWPTAARVSFVGWRLCPPNTNGWIVIDLIDTGTAWADHGYEGSNASMELKLGVLRSDFADGLIPHELGHNLGFSHEMAHPDFVDDYDPAWQCYEGNATGERLTDPDRDSIMASTGYCHYNAHLSPLDREGVLVAYGAREYRFAASTQWSTWTTDYDYQLADVNGDGAADLVGRKIGGDLIHVGLSTGNGFAPSTQWSTWGVQADHKFADVNGDGRADLIGRVANVIHVGLSTGSSFAPSTEWSAWTTDYEHRFADVNGDGRADLVGRQIGGVLVHVGLSTGSSFAPSTQWTEWGANADYTLADANGDGRVDMGGRVANLIHIGLSSN